MIDLYVIVLVFGKLMGGEKLRTIEKRDLFKRCLVSLVKYLIRDPIYDQFTLPLIRKIFTIFRLPETLYGIVLSILNYWKYYTFIA